MASPPRPPRLPPPSGGRIDIAGIRRAQIVEAAVRIIASQGLHNLSLSKIEKQAGMSRGQLTHYFPTKEDILLAVFDRLLLLMYQRIGAAECPAAAGDEPPEGWALVRNLLQTIIGRGPVSPEFHALQYTFLAQIGHREDFRARLANLYEEWRGGLAEHLRARPHAAPGPPPAPPRLLASLVQAILHGVAMQLAADPGAFDRQEMLRLCLRVLAPLFGSDPGEPRPPAAPRRRTAARNGVKPRKGRKRDE
ncbi:MAG TPA: TetR/AcrR family transcriptional regulator [Gemmataceae bacterium]